MRFQRKSIFQSEKRSHTEISGVFTEHIENGETIPFDASKTIATTTTTTATKNVAVDNARFNNVNK